VASGDLPRWWSYPRVRARTPLGTWPGHRVLVTVRLRSGPYRARPRAPDRQLPRARLPVALVQATPRPAVTHLGTRPRRALTSSLLGRRRQMAIGWSGCIGIWVQSPSDTNNHALSCDCAMLAPSPPQAARRVEDLPPAICPSWRAIPSPSSAPRPRSNWGIDRRPAPRTLACPWP
jgi:hypothetical protein